MKMPPGLRITSTAGEESGRSGKSASAGAGEALRFANGAVLTDADLDAVSGSMWMSNVGEAMFGMNGGSPAGALAGAAECAVLGACIVARPRRRTLLFADIMLALLNCFVSRTRPACREAAGRGRERGVSLALSSSRRRSLVVDYGMTL
jgi:hypothetical protein